MSNTANHTDTNNQARRVFATATDEQVMEVFVRTVTESARFTPRQARDMRRFCVQEFVARHGEQFAADFVEAAQTATADVMGA